MYKPKIMIINSREDILYGLSRILVYRNYEVLAVAHENKIIAQTERFLPDVILLDVRVPSTDGLTLCRKLKKNKKVQHTPIILMTAMYIDPKSRIEGLDAGADDYLVEPIDFYELEARIRSHLRIKRFQDQLEERNCLLRAQQRRIEQDLKLAELVQRSMVPGPVKSEYLDVAVAYHPALKLGGDFSNIYFKNDTLVYLSLGDVTGHSIAAALFMNRIYGVVKRLVREETHCRTICAGLNNFIVQSFQGTEMFLSFFSAAIDLAAMTFTYSGCGHPPVLYWKSRSNEFISLDSQNALLGIKLGSPKKIKEDVIPLELRDKIIFYTDGLIETRNNDGKPLWIAGLKEILKKYITASHPHLIKSVIETVDTYRYGALKDDLYLMVVEITGSPDPHIA